MSQRAYVQARINGEPLDFLCEPRQSLLEVLRDELRLTGTKEGCNNGNCGACNVILNGALVNSCCVLGVEARAPTIATIEGVAHGDELHPLQQSVPGERGSAVRHLHAGLHRRRQGAAR